MGDLNEQPHPARGRARGPLVFAFIWFVVAAFLLFAALWAGLLIAPDGVRAFVACSDAGKVQVLDLGTLTITGSVATGNQPDGMAYSTR